MTELTDLITKTSAQELMVQTLKDFGFEGDLTRGSPVYQLLIDPNAIIYAMQVAKQDELRNSWSLLSGKVTESGINEEAVYNIFNNLRILPAPGSKSTGRIHLVFGDNTVRTLRGETFLSSVGESFESSESYTLIPSESYRTEHSSTELVYKELQGSYAVDIEVTASVIGNFIVGSGDIFTSSIPGLRSAIASTSFSGGETPETIEDLIKGVPEILSETSGISPISVAASLRNEFPSISEIVIFRAGDPEMQRANKNVLGVDSGAADIVLTTSVKPTVTRIMTQGHLELKIDQDGVLYNSDHRLGYSFRQAASDEDDDMVKVDEILNGYVFIDGELTSREIVGLSSVISSGIRNEDTPLNSLATPSSEIDDYLTITSRGLVQDDRYGNLPVEGADPKDFYFSSYQHRLSFEFRTDWEEVESVVEGAYAKVYAWISFWRAYYQEVETGSDLSAEKTALAATFGIAIPSQMPRYYRPEISIYSDVVYYSGLDKIQTYLNDDSRRCFGQDYIVKTPHLHAVELSITLSRDSNFVRFREEYFKTKISDFISSRGMRHTTSITTEHIKNLIFEEGPDDANDSFALVATTSTQRHSGEFETFSGDHVSYLEDDTHGVTTRNSILVCSSEQIIITYI